MFHCKLPFSAKHPVRWITDIFIAEKNFMNTGNLSTFLLSASTTSLKRAMALLSWSVGTKILPFHRALSTIMRPPLRRILIDS